MENVSVGSLKQQIRVALDENHVSTELTNLQDTDTLTLDELIVSKIEDAAEAVVRSAPIDMLSDIGEVLNEAYVVHSPAPYFLKMVLPANFLRLIRFKVTGWDYAVHEVVLPTRDMQMKLHSPYGVLGTVDRPVILISPTRVEAAVDPNDPLGENAATVEPIGSGTASLPTTTRSGLMLEAFCVPTGIIELDNCLYAARPKITTTTQDTTTIQQIQLGDRLIRPTVYYAAYLVASVVGEEKAAQNLLAVCKEMLNLQ